MTEHFGWPISSQDGRAMGEQSVLDARAIPRPQLAYRRRISNKLAVFGMAIGYLGLVAVLASVPIWNQALTPNQQPIAACSDFGGNR